MIKLPKHVEDDMKEYRAGIIWSVPESFIDFHARLADVDRRYQDWVILEDHGLENDGWCDGMKVRELVVAYKENNVWHTATIKWHTSGAWFEKGAGWTRFREMYKR